MPVTREERTYPKEGTTYKEEVLKTFDLYKWTAKQWKYKNPAYHSCIRCLHHNPKAWKYCPKAKLHRSKIYTYYPNQCEFFEETKSR